MNDYLLMQKDCSYNELVFLSVDEKVNSSGVLGWRVYVYFLRFMKYKI